MTKQEALALSKLMSAPDIFPEAKQAFTRTLLDYYKELLYRPPHPPVPTPRRMR